MPIWDRGVNYPILQVRCELAWVILLIYWYMDAYMPSGRSAWGAGYIIYPSSDNKWINVRMAALAIAAIIPSSRDKLTRYRSACGMPDFSDGEIINVFISSCLKELDTAYVNGLILFIWIMGEQLRGSIDKPAKGPYWTEVMYLCCTRHYVHDWDV